MNIRSIDLIVHPNFYQIPVPNFPLHKKQVELRELWSKRFNELADQEDSLLIYLSFMSDEMLSTGFSDISKISNRIEQDEIKTIQGLKHALGKRLLFYGWILLLDEKQILEAFRAREVVYTPEEIRLHAYGEVFETCVTAWAYYLANMLDIPHPNIHLSPLSSLTNSDCVAISKWRLANMVRSPAS